MSINFLTCKTGMEIAYLTVCVVQSAKLCPILCNSMDCSTPNSPICPSLSPRVCSNSYPLSQWSHPTICSSVAPLSSCPQSFPALGSFPVSRLFASGGQRIGASASASASVCPVNSQSWFPVGLIVLISSIIVHLFTQQIFRVWPLISPYHWDMIEKNANKIPIFMYFFFYWWETESKANSLVHINKRYDFWHIVNIL